MNYASCLTIDEKVISLLQPDTLAPHQYIKTLRRKDCLGPEEQLMLGVLEDAIFCFQKYLFARDITGRRLFHEAQDWILETDSDWMFSFGSICEVLGFSPTYMRDGLLRWKKQKLARPSRAENQKLFSRSQGAL